MLNLTPNLHLNHFQTSLSPITVIMPIITGRSLIIQLNIKAATLLIKKAQSGEHKNQLHN